MCALPCSAKKGFRGPEDRSSPHTCVHVYRYLSSTCVLISTAVNSMIPECLMRQGSLLENLPVPVGGPWGLPAFMALILTCLVFWGTCVRRGQHPSEAEQGCTRFEKELVISGIVVFMRMLLITHEIYLVLGAALVRCINSRVHRIFFVSTSFCY